MLDLRTLLVLLAVADLILAAGLWLGASRGMRDGLTQWAASLLVRAAALSILSVGVTPGTGALAVAGALLALSLTLQADAMLAFERRKFAVWIHSAALAAVAIPLQLLEREPAEAVLFGGVVLGSLMLVLAAIARQLRATPGSRARYILLGSFLAAGVAFMLRGLGAAFAQDALAGFHAPSGFAAATFLACFAAALAATLAFLLLHKERAEAEALRLATMDALTGAYNRRTFHETAE